MATLLTSASLLAETRTYAGGFSTRWNTTGWHGHDIPLCPEAAERGPAACNDVDYDNANLDNSIGFRFGQERDVRSRGPIQFLIGAEAAFIDSEYNLSQDHVAFVSASGIAGVDYVYRNARFGLRAGGGPFITSDGRAGAEAFAEVGAIVPIRSGAGVRVAHRFGLRRGETSILLVASPRTAETRWEFAASAGLSNPDGLNLRPAAFQRTAALFSVTRNVQVQAAWTATAHESTELTTFQGFPGNERGKTVEAFGLSVRHSTVFAPSWSLHYGGGIELADWADEHQLLGDVVAGKEYGLAAGAALRFALMRYAALEGSVEHISWPDLDLGETRWGLGLVLTR